MRDNSISIAKAISFIDGFGSYMFFLICKLLDNYVSYAFILFLCRSVSSSLNE